MRRVGGADELVVGDAEPAPTWLGSVRRRSSTSACGAMPALLGGLRDLLPVLVHPDEEVHVVAAQAAIAGDGVGADLLERVAEVRSRRWRSRWRW